MEKRLDREVSEAFISSLSTSELHWFIDALKGLINEIQIWNVMSKDNSMEERLDRIEDLKHKVEEETNGEMNILGLEECPLEIEEKFWEYVLAFEQGEQTPLFEILTDGGIALPAPDTLDDVEITKKLWEVINALSLLGVFLYSTDHLSDREFYENLYNKSLQEEYFIQPTNKYSAWHVDLIGSGSDEDNYIYHKYYADEEERIRWANDFPDDELPPPEKKPYDRDRYLPKREDWGEEGVC